MPTLPGPSPLTADSAGIVVALGTWQASTGTAHPSRRRPPDLVPGCYNSGDEVTRWPRDRPSASDIAQTSRTRSADTGRPPASTSGGPPSTTPVVMTWPRNARLWAGLTFRARVPRPPHKVLRVRLISCFGALDEHRAVRASRGGGALDRDVGGPHVAAGTQHAPILGIRRRARSRPGSPAASAGPGSSAVVGTEVIRCRDRCSQTPG